jgi:hypothetical protein
MLGTNDLRNRWAKPDEEVTGEQMIAGLQQMAVRAHSTSRRLNSCLLIDNTAMAHLPGPQNPGMCHLYLAEGCHLYIAPTKKSRERDVLENSRRFGVVRRDGSTPGGDSDDAANASRLLIIW